MIDLTRAPKRAFISSNPAKSEILRDAGLGSHDAPIPDGAELLSKVEIFIRRFCVLPSESDYVATALWVVHAHMVEHFDTSPRLAVLSPEPGSGKTRALEVLDLLTPNTMFVFSASPAAIFRTIAVEQTTLLFDESDTIFGRQGKDDQNEDLRALLNVGYRKGATIPRCVGSQHEVQRFNVFCAVALAGLGDLPDTVMTRSIVVRMRRRAPHECVEPFRLREQEHQGHAIRDQLAAWADHAGKEAGAAWPVLPSGVVDRAAEVWEPLIAAADAAGGCWPDRARAACVEICGGLGTRGQSLGVRLLMDLKLIFGDADALYTSTILERLCGSQPYGRDAEGDPTSLTDGPWSDLRGEPLDARRLARMLDKYGVASAKIREGGNGRPLQGYRRSDLWDTWQRYAIDDKSPGLPRLEHPEQMERARADQESDGSACSGRSGDADIAEEFDL